MSRYRFKTVSREFRCKSVSTQTRYKTTRQMSYLLRFEHPILESQIAKKEVIR